MKGGGGGEGRVGMKRAGKEEGRGKGFGRTVTPAGMSTLICLLVCIAPCDTTQEESDKDTGEADGLDIQERRTLISLEVYIYLLRCGPVPIHGSSSLNNPSVLIEISTLSSHEPYYSIYIYGPFRTCPLHSGHLSATTSPLPLQSGHTVCVCMMPNAVRCVCCVF